MVRLPAAALLLAALVAPAASALSWSVVAQPKRGMKANGPIETASLGEAPNIAVLFGGWTGTAAAVKAWAGGLSSSATPSLAELGVGALYSVPGPHDSGYRVREHPLDAFAAALAAEADKRGSKLIIVAAHSSGAFVADAALAVLAKKRADLLGRVAFFKLDGGFAPDLTPAAFAKLGAIFCVAAKCGAVPSRNFGGMMSGCKRPTGGKAKVITVAAAGSGCKKPNCCHDALITSKPHDPNNFSVVKDYSNFTGGRVPVGAWLGQARKELERIAARP